MSRVCGKGNNGFCVLSCWIHGYKAPHWVSPQTHWVKAPNINWHMAHWVSLASIDAQNLAPIGVSDARRSPIGALMPDAWC